MAEFRGFAVQYVGDACNLGQSFGLVGKNLWGPLGAPQAISINVAIMVLTLVIEARRGGDHGDCGERSSEVLARVIATRQRQIERQGCLNAVLGNRDIERHCALSPALERVLARAIDKLALSARSYHKLLRLARTIADLDAESQIGETHLAEAISYRRIERMS